MLDAQMQIQIQLQIKLHIFTYCKEWIRVLGELRGPEVSSQPAGDPGKLTDELCQSPKAENQENQWNNFLYDSESKGQRRQVASCKTVRQRENTISYLTFCSHQTFN